MSNAKSYLYNDTEPTGWTRWKGEDGVMHRAGDETDVKESVRAERAERGEDE